MSREPGEYRATALYLRYSSTGEFIDTLLIAPGEEKSAFREGSSFGNRPLLFSRGHKVTLGGQQSYEGANGEYRIMVRPVGERPERIVTRIGELRQVESAELEEAVRKMTEGRVRRQGELAEMLGTSSAAARKPDIPHRDSYPAFNRLLIDSEDHLWVQAYPVPGEAHHEWSVFDPAGYWLGDLQVPASLHIYQIGSDFILGRWQDEFEVHYIRIYELTRGEMAETAPDPPATDREIMEVLPNVQSRLENALQKLDRLYPTSYLPPVTIAGDVAYSHLPELVRGREQEIETAFLEAHDQRDLSAWVYNTLEGEIGDLGYCDGDRIAKANYQTATAKDRALREIREMTEARESLAESQWRPGMTLTGHDSSHISADDYTASHRRSPRDLSLYPRPRDRQRILWSAPRPSSTHRGAQPPYLLSLRSGDATHLRSDPDYQDSRPGRGRTDTTPWYRGRRAYLLQSRRRRAPHLARTIGERWRRDRGRRRLARGRTIYLCTRSSRE